MINYENQFDPPRDDGHFFRIECLMFKGDHAKLMSNIPYGLTVID